MIQRIDATLDQLAAAFAEWERRYREAPEQFASDMELLAMNIGTYGERCAIYMQRLLYETSAK